MRTDSPGLVLCKDVPAGVLERAGTGCAPDAARKRAWEVGLPAYLQHDLDAYKKGLAENSTLLDCLWGELYGSINGAEIDDGAITHEHAQYLRDKYLWGKAV